MSSDIGIPGSIGIILLWNLDLMVYHRLLDAVFIEGLKIEDEYQWLPPVRNNMMKAHGGKGVLPRVVWFYVAGNSILLMVSGAAFVFWLHKFGIIAVIVGIVLYLLIIFYLSHRIIQKTASTTFIRSELQKNGTEWSTSGT